MNDFFFVLKKLQNKFSTKLVINVQPNRMQFSISIFSYIFLKLYQRVRSCGINSGLLVILSTIYSLLIGLVGSFALFKIIFGDNFPNIGFF